MWVNPQSYRSCLEVPGLINKVDISRLAKTKSQGNSLQLTTRKVLNLEVSNHFLINHLHFRAFLTLLILKRSHLLVYDVINLERSHDIGDELRVNISVPDSVVQKLSSGSLGNKLL